MREKGVSIWLKAVAVTSAVALGGGYVMWKDAQAKNARIDPLEKRVEAREQRDAGDVTLFVGSKSPGREVITIPGIPTAERSPELEGTLMPGSKSARVMPLPVEDPPPPRVLPGSKSLSPIFETPGQTDKP